MPGLAWGLSIPFHKPFATALYLYLRPVVRLPRGRASCVEAFIPRGQRCTRTLLPARNTWREQMRCASLGLALALIFVNVSCTGTTKSSPGSTPPSQITVSVTPTAANVRAGAGQPFTASVTGTSNQSVTWSVNGVAGGNATVGTITNTGVYTAPEEPKNTNTTTIRTDSDEDAGESD